MATVVEVNRSEQVIAEALARVAVRRLAAGRVDPYIEDPTGWVEARLGAHLWSKQREICDSVRDNRRTAVHSCHESGKSFLAARLALWWLEVHPVGTAFVVTTAPTTPQVRAILWQEIRTAHLAAGLRGRTNLTELWYGNRVVAFGRKPSDYSPSAFQGIHSKYVLVIIDEASGVPVQLFTAAGSLAANEFGRILAIGNPDDSLSHFAKVCEPDSGWSVVHIDGLKTPNFTGEPIPDELRHYLISPIYVEELARDVGEDSPIYVSKARGRFPEDKSDGVIPLSWIRRAQLPREEPWAEEDLLPVELGVDVGAGGDETVIYEHRGRRIGGHWRYRTPDFTLAKGHVLRHVRETGATRVKVDVIGIGWGLAGALREVESEMGFETVGVNVAVASNDQTRFPRFRDEMWWEAGREAIRSGGLDMTEVDDETVAQLISPTWRPDARGRHAVEPKAKTRERLKGRSPDLADALLLSVCEPPNDGAVELSFA